MRIVSTVLLILAVAAAWTAVEWVHKGDALPPPPAGEPLVRFSADEVSQIQLRRSGEAANLNPVRHVWYLTKPLTDRLDPTAALALYMGLNGLELVDTISEVERVDSGTPLEAYGLGEEAVRVRLLGTDQETLHDFRLGDVTPWQRGEDPTMYLQWRSGPRPDDIYVVAGNLRVLLDRPFDSLRAREALYLPRPPLHIALLRGRERLELARPDPGSPWRILLPIKERADEEAVAAFLKSLSEVRANALTPWEKSPLAAPDALRLVVAMTPVDDDDDGGMADRIARLSPDDPVDDRMAPTLLEAVVVEDPGNPGQVLARFSDRRFDLHLPAGILATLDPDPTRFRARTLADIDATRLASISIEDPGAIGDPSILERPPGEGWGVLLRNRIAPADAASIATFVRRFNNTRILGFPTDSLSAPSRWGFDQPVRRVAFEDRDGRVRRFLLGRREDRVYAQDLDRPSVYEVDPQVIPLCRASAPAWRSRRLLRFDAIDLRTIAVARRGAPPLALGYAPEENRWTALAGDEDRSADLDPAAAANFAAELGKLRAERWLTSGVGALLPRFAEPDLRLALTVVPTTPEGLPLDPVHRRLAFVRVAEGSRLFYGRLDREPDIFLITEERLAELGSQLWK